MLVSGSATIAATTRSIKGDGAGNAIAVTGTRNELRPGEWFERELHGHAGRRDE